MTVNSNGAEAIGKSGLTDFVDDYFRRHKIQFLILFIIYVLTIVGTCAFGFSRFGNDYSWLSGFGIFGFWISFSALIGSLWQWRKSVGIATASKSATERTLRQLTKQIVAEDLIRVSERLDRISELQHQRQWTRVAGSYSDTIQMLFDIEANLPELDDETRSSLKLSGQRLAGIRDRVSDAVGTNSSPLIPVEELEIVTSTSLIIMEIKSRISTEARRD